MHRWGRTLDWRLELVAPVIVLGHRGASALAVENSLEAFAAALNVGAAGSELDVRTSADGVLVCIHDATVVVDGEPRRVCDAPASSLGAATLTEALDVLAGSLAVVEIKNQPWDACYDATLAIAEAVAVALPPGAVAACFDPASLARVLLARPDVRTAVITPSAIDPMSNLHAALSGGHQICSVEESAIDARFVDAAHDAGKQVYAWATDDPARVSQLAAIGVDALMCDDPGRALAALGA
jgi:glycerophosphoryl diester phosphodiesterase